MLSVASLASADVQAVSQVNVQQEEGVTRVILRGAEDPIYTAFMLSGPPRLLLDLPDVVFDGVETPIQVQNGLVGEITLGAFGDPRVSPSMARVSIGLMAESDYEVIPNGDEIVVEIRPKSAAGEAVAARTVRTTEPSSKKAAPSQPSSKEAPAPKATAKPAPRPAAKAAKQVSRIVRVVPNEAWIAVQAEGPVDNVDSFVVHGPERLVVDFWGAQNAEPRSVIPVPGSIVKQVRVGQHPDKVRLVLDLEGELLSHAVEPTRNGVRIRLHGKTSEASQAASTETVPAAPAVDVKEEGEAVFDAADHAASPSVEERPAKPAREEKAASTETAPAAPAVGVNEEGEAVFDAADHAASPSVEEKPTKPARSTQVGRVQSVHFESFAEMDRVVVTLDRSAETVVAEPDTATVVVDLPGTRIEPAAERRVSTREFGGPVQMLSAFQTPDIDYDQVRVVLKRSRPVRPRLTWDGAKLFIEMPRQYVHAPSAPQSAGASAQGSEEAPAGAADATAEAVPSSGSGAAAAPSPGGPLQPADGEDSFYEGPFEPASIDLLEEGGLTEEKAYQGKTPTSRTSCV
jgi:type IV pilus assembly protein PilQ